jgi:hypothetical protein
VAIPFPGPGFRIRKQAGPTPLELEAELGAELNDGIDVFHHDADVVRGRVAPQAA